ncbi:deoxyribose-phosphate aldolase [Dokdonia sinensis]|uniref:Deoxyribose-phosphate aldolase n=1 Tax=Dokdonia sinensis TaxID=2479847 RepID=A0A3M0GHG0_9FLAO|nr:deoxyribose-phosphate aldolase [Dokdonia sinensis]RMB64120.1 deoxyribose-phosphate aldolase [Dokdonia sinensis]
MQLGPYIEHTLLHPTVTKNAIKKLCRQAIQYRFYGVCVPECYVALAQNMLTEHPIKVIAVVGFPLGNQSTVAKVCEAKHAILLGASEIDMVLNIGFLKSGLFDKISDEIAEIKKAIGSRSLKVILETCYLSDEEIELGCKLAIKGNADFVKTSTGFGTAGATLEHIALMRRASKGLLKIKASGGIKDRATAIQFISAGADRIGTSNGVQLVL